VRATVENDEGALAARVEADFDNCGAGPFEFLAWTAEARLRPYGGVASTELDGRVARLFMRVSARGAD
jgi:hypothetical protein